MATQQDVVARSETLVDDHDAITAVLQAYIDGSAKGDEELLRSVFDEHARMYGSVGGQRLDLPIQEFFALAAGSPADSAGTYRGRVMSVSVTGDAAVGTVIEDGFWGTLSFVDYFALARLDGRWRIVSKVFEHTAGVPPAR